MCVCVVQYEPRGGGRTLVVVPGQVPLVDEEVVVRVQLPELAVDDVEVLVGEELRQLVHVLLLVQQGHVLQPSKTKKERQTFKPSFNEFNLHPNTAICFVKGVRHRFALSFV